MKFGIRETLFLAAMLGLLACSYFLVFSKAEKKRADLIAQIEKKQKELTDLERTTAGNADIDRRVAELQEAITFFESKLPQEREVANILEQLWPMAKQNGQTTRTVKPLQTVRTANISEQPIEMSLSGDFNGFYAFLLELEQMKRLTRVTKLDLQKINNRDGEMDARMTLSIFFEPETGSSMTATASTN